MVKKIDVLSDGKSEKEPESGLFINGKSVPYTDGKVFKFDVNHFNKDDNICTKVINKAIKGIIDVSRNKVIWDSLYYEPNVSAFKPKHEELYKNLFKPKSKLGQHNNFIRELQYYEFKHEGETYIVIKDNKSTINFNSKDKDFYHPDSTDVYEVTYKAGNDVRLVNGSTLPLGVNPKEDVIIRNKVNTIVLINSKVTTSIIEGVNCFLNTDIEIKRTRDSFVEINNRFDIIKTSVILESIIINSRGNIFDSIHKSIIIDSYIHSSDGYSVKINDSLLNGCDLFGNKGVTINKTCISEIELRFSGSINFNQSIYKENTKELFISNNLIHQGYSGDFDKHEISIVTPLDLGTLTIGYLVVNTIKCLNEDGIIQLLVTFRYANGGASRKSYLKEIVIDDDSVFDDVYDSVNGALGLRPNCVHGSIAESISKFVLDRYKLIMFKEVSSKIGI